MKKYIYTLAIINAFCAFKAVATENLPSPEIHRNPLISLFTTSVSDHKSSHLRHKANKIIKAIEKYQKSLEFNKEKTNNFKKIDHKTNELRTLQKELNLINSTTLTSLEAQKRESVLIKLQSVINPSLSFPHPLQDSGIVIKENQIMTIVPTVVVEKQPIIPISTILAKKQPIMPMPIDMMEKQPIMPMPIDMTEKQPIMPMPIDMTEKQPIMLIPIDVIKKSQPEKEDEIQTGNSTKFSHIDALPSKISNNTLGFFDSHIKHRLIRLTIVSALSYIKAVYQEYKSNPQSSKNVLLKQALKNMTHDQFFKIGIISALLFPKMPFE